MFINRLELMETVYMSPEERASQVEEVPHEAVPIVTSYPYSNVRIMKDASDKTGREHGVPISEWPVEHEVDEGMIIIGGASLHSLESARARKQTASSQRLAVEGTVSYANYRAKVEASRMTKIKHAFGRVLQYIGIRPYDDGQVPVFEVADETEPVDVIAA